MVHYLKFSEAWAKALDLSDEILSAAAGERMGNQKGAMGFTFLFQAREFWLASGIHVSTGAIMKLFGMFDLTVMESSIAYWADAEKSGR